MAYENEVAKGFKALTALHSSVSDQIFTRIMSCETSKQVWDKLQEEYQGNTRTRQMQILNLRRAFETLKMKDNELVKDFSDRLMKIVNEIKVLGEPLSDQRIVEKVLVSLPEKFEAKISSLEESRDLSIISLSELINALQATEQRRSIRKEESLENAFVAKGKNNKKNNGASSSRPQQQGQRQQGYPPCQYCKKHGHAPTKCFWRPDAFCGRCGQNGHIDKVCKQQQQQQQQQANVANANEIETLFVASSSATNDGLGWIVDSGCSHHMTYNEAYFVKLDKTYSKEVKIGNGSHVNVKGKGDISIHTSKGTKLIKDVLYVPSLCENLLSVAQLVEKGYSLSFSNNCCKILDSHDNVVMNVEKEKKNFKIKMQASNLVHLRTKDENISQLWHKELGDKKKEKLEKNEKKNDDDELYVHVAQLLDDDDELLVHDQVTCHFKETKKFMTKEELLGHEQASWKRKERKKKKEKNTSMSQVHNKNTRQGIWYGYKGGFGRCVKKLGKKRFETLRTSLNVSSKITKEEC